jgi:hypothetical protein
MKINMIYMMGFLSTKVKIKWNPSSVDSRKTDIINDHISDTSENSDASNLTQVHNRTPSINDTVSSNIKMNMPMN